MPAPSQAEEYVLCTDVHYRPYRPEGPRGLPTQNRQRLDVGTIMAMVFAVNEPTYKGRLTQRWRAQLLHLVTESTALRHFFRDAFWWLFAHHFAAVDLSVLLGVAQRNIHVSDADAALLSADAVRRRVQMMSARGPDPPRTGPGGRRQSQSPRGPMTTRSGDAMVFLPPIADRSGESRVRPPHMPGHLSTSTANRSSHDVVHIACPTSPRPEALLSMLRRELTGAADRAVNIPQGQGPRPGDLDDLDQDGDGGGSGECSPRPMSAASSAEDILEARAFHETVLDTDDDTDTDASGGSGAAVEVRLWSLAAAARSDIVSKEHHKIFTRMAMNYGKLLTGLLVTPVAGEAEGANIGCGAFQRLQPTVMRDVATRFLPDLVAQGLYLAFCLSLPFAVASHLDAAFQQSVARHVYFWMTGVEVARRPVTGAVMHLAPGRQPTICALDGSLLRNTRVEFPTTVLTASTVKVTRFASSASSGLSSAPTHAAAVTQELRDSLYVTSWPVHNVVTVATRRRREFLAYVREGRTSLAHFPKVDLPSLFIELRTAVQHSKGGGTAFRGVPIAAPPPTTSPRPPPRSPSRLTSARRARAVPGPPKTTSPTKKRIVTRTEVVNRQVTAFQREMDRLHTTYTFASALNFLEGEADPLATGTSGQPKRERGPTVRNVHIIKKELDEHYQPIPPWYMRPNARIRRRDSDAAADVTVQAERSPGLPAPFARFILTNWSPLIQRFMLLTGVTNTVPPESMSWTS